MSPRTVFLSKLIGLYCLILAFSMVLHKELTIEEITALAGNSPVMLVVGVFTLFAGLAMVLGHNVWRGGGVTIVVTLIGWLTLLKALLILFVPPNVEPRFLLEPLRSDSLFYFRLALTFLLGIYLTYGGFAASPKNRPGVS
jgi:putative exporter of polyketide antibiotics